MMYNCHIHTFLDEDIPNKFLPFGLVPILRTKIGNRIIGKTLHNLIPFSDNDLFDRYKKFASTGRLPNQKSVFYNCSKYYPSNTIFCVLTMDMSQMGAGEVPRDHRYQVDELLMLANKQRNTNKEIRPFIHIDPRADVTIQDFKSWHAQGMAGMKLYCSLGYFPYDERLFPFYEYCQNNDLPVIAHCSPANPVHFKGSKKELIELLEYSLYPIDPKGKSRKELCSEFANPTNYAPVMQRFPRLRIDCAHLGSMSEVDKYLEQPDKESWTKTIFDMCKLYDGFYTDISFTMAKRKYNPMLIVNMRNNPVLASKILFGSDYYMNETENNERRWSMELRADIGEDLWRQITKTNPKKFLGIK